MTKEEAIGKLKRLREISKELAALEQKQKKLTFFRDTLERMAEEPKGTNPSSLRAAHLTEQMEAVMFYGDKV